MNNTVDVYQAISDPKRRRMLDLLAERERSVQELLPYFDVTLGAISQHLKILLEGGLVSRRKKGRFRYYRTQPQALKQVHDWTERYRRFWESRLDRLSDYLNDGQ